MKKENEFEITHEGILSLGELKIPCYVLKNGERVLSTTGMQRALGVIENEPRQRSSGRLDEILTSKIVSRFISSDKVSSQYTPIYCFQGKKKISAYKAIMLPEICEVMLKVRDYARKNNIELGIRQQAVVIQSDIIIRSLAKVGIIALVDEATGYQKVRGKHELQKFLDKFLLQEHAKYIPTFEDEFFETIYKMKGWDWDIVNKGKNPSVMGHYINNFVYSRVAPLVLIELKKLNPAQETQDGNWKGRKHKHTQYIDKNFGHPKLKEHIAAIIALGKASGYNWRNFQRLVNRAFPKFGHSIELGFPDADIVD